MSYHITLLFPPMENRRNFLKRFATGLAVGLAAPWVVAGANTENKPPEAEEACKDEWERLRKEFEFVPDQTYLNTATLGLMSNTAVDALESHLRKRVRQGRYWLEPNATDVIARFVNAKPEEIAITHNTTEGINIVAQGLKLRRGDAVILSSEEHAGNAVPWLNRAKRDGIVLKVFRPADTVAETMERINSLIDSSTRAIAVPHLTCTTGHMLPIAEIGRLAKEKGLFSFIDGAHGAGAVPLDMKALGVDFYAGCGHKWLCGPAGTGFLYVSQDKIDALDTVFAGANSDEGWTLTPEKQELGEMRREATRYAYGTQSAFQHAGLCAAVEFMEGIGMDKVHRRQLELHAYLRSKLETFPELEFLTPTQAESHGALLTFRDPSRPLKPYIEQFALDKVRVRIVMEYEWNAIRVAPHIYTLHRDLDQLVSSIRSVTSA